MPVKQSRYFLNKWRRRSPVATFCFIRAARRKSVSSSSCSWSPLTADDSGTRSTARSSPACETGSWALLCPSKERDGALFPADYAFGHVEDIEGFGRVEAEVGDRVSSVLALVAPGDVVSIDVHLRDFESTIVAMKYADTSVVKLLSLRPRYSLWGYYGGHAGIAQAFVLENVCSRDMNGCGNLHQRQVHK
uniref:Uncharacterized protein n=1 Tax=Peronospora matthiolae TaxID=2874970 RepID=A0AAV1U6B4_9STRA